MNESTDTYANPTVAPRRILRSKSSRGAGWSPERRAKFEATMAAKRGEGTEGNGSTEVRYESTTQASTRKRAALKRPVVPVETVKHAIDHLKDGQEIINARIADGATKISEE